MKRTIIYAVVALGMTAVSCNKSGLESPGVPGEPNAEPVTIALSSVSAPVSVTTFAGGQGTKSTPEMAEGAIDGQIHDLWAIQYDKDGKLVGTPYYTTDIPAGTAGTPGSGTDYTHSGLSLKLTSSGGAAHTVCFVANTHNGSLLTVDNDVSTLSKLHSVVTGIGDEYKPTAAGGIVMMGKYTGPVASGTPVTGVRLQRLAAKVVLRYKSTVPGLTITGVQLKNAASGIHYCSEPASGTDFPTADNTPGRESHLDYPAEDLTKAVADGDYKTFCWYVPENLRKATAAVLAIGDRTPDKTDGLATYVEVSGIVRDGDRCRKASFRILLGDLGGAGTDFTDFNVRRNHIYTVTLDIKGLNAGDNRVTVEDYDMSNSAMIRPGGADSVIFDVRKCLNNGFTTREQLNALLVAGSALTADVLWQDGNVINTADVSLDKLNGLLIVKSSKATVGNAVIALYPNASKNQGEILWSWHVWVTDYRPGETGVATRSANAAITVPGGQVHTYGTEFQKVNGTSKVIMDRNLGATKTYYAAPAANDMTAQEAFGMFYQWGRKDPFPRATSATVEVTAATTIPIYGPNGTTVLPEDGTGYKKVAVATALSGAANGLAYAVKNPLTFIYNAAAPYDWYTSTNNNSAQNNALWGDGAAKSDYDPCPTGWRIAPNGTWSDFTRTSATAGTFLYWEQGAQSEAAKYYLTNGRYYIPTSGTVRTWYPAPGFRDAGNNGLFGALGNVGNHGYSWSSSVSTTLGMGLGFSSAWLNPSRTNNRAHGFQVRCLQE